MMYKKIELATFSPTGNVEKTVKAIGKVLGSELDLPVAEFSFNKPEKRKDVRKYGEDTILVIGLPVYAGRLPNKILPYIHENIKGMGNSVAIPVVCFGNRSFDDGLSELVYELTGNGFTVPGGCAVCSQHAFSEEVGKGRPDDKDIKEAEEFAVKVAEKIKMGNLETVKVEGHMPPGNYYVPLGMDDVPVDFLKAKPKTDMGRCTNCKTCYNVCPMDSINFEDVSKVDGICIKCQACVKYCPEGAKYFDDVKFLSHIAYLENHYSESEMRSRFFY